MKEQKESKSLEIVEKQRALVVEKIIEDMKREGLHWSEPNIPSLSPHNPVSGTVYQGGNRFHLGFVGYMRGFADNRWCTFNQIRDSGWHLKKGAKAALIEKWREFSIREENEDTGEKEVTGHYLRCVGYWIVINASETFLSDETFTRVLLHEMTHSTGHPSALNRGCNTDFGSPEYAQEELVAELGSLFLSADLGIQNTDYEGEHYENHISYLQSWMHALEDDPSYLFKAAAKADKAGTLIIGRYNDVLEKRRDRDVERAPEKVSLKGEVTAMKDAAKSHDEQAKAPEIAVSAR